MSADPNTPGASPDAGGGFDVAQFLKKLQKFATAFVEVELTGFGAAHLEVSPPSIDESGTVKFGRELKYTIGVNNGKFTVDVSAA